MTALPPAATKVHLDQDSDDIYQARVELAAHTDKINTIISYLAGLFGSDGQQLTAQSVLGVGFPSGTLMVFVQSTVPIGWVRNFRNDDRYLVIAGSGAGYAPFGDSNFFPYTTSTVLQHGHLPSVNISGVTSYIDNHVHQQQITGIQFNNPGVASVRVEAGDGYYVFISNANVSAAATHNHNVTIPLGGLNWPHNHAVDFSNYRPIGITSIIGVKI